MTLAVMDNRNLIREEATITDALKLIDDVGTSLSTLFVINTDGEVIGALTDGDIRRGLIKGCSMNDKVGVIMNRTFKFIHDGDLSNYTADLGKIRQMGIRFIPVLDNKRKLVSIIDLEVTLDAIPMDAFILAGGKGERLFPVTRDIPKPLIKVGDKPIIGHNISRLVRYGISNIYISVNYLAEKIEQHFGDGKSYDASVKYVKETSPLGTLGSISLIDDELSEDVLVMNSDLLTNIDFTDFYRSYKESGAAMAVVVKPFYQDFPYAVLETDENNFVKGLKEKPRYTYYTNAGIYIIKSSIIKKLQRGSYLDATDLIEKLVADGEKVYSYSIIKYWLDIGKPEDLRKALEDIKHLQI